MDEQNRILQSIITRYHLNPYEKYEYVGATIIKRMDFPGYTEILFCEDGFTDENGVPYVMQSRIVNGYNRDRIMVLYTHDMDRIIIPVEGDNWTLIGNEIPENVKNMDYDKAKLIINRKTLGIRQNPEKVSDGDIRNLQKIYSKKYTKGALVVAGLLTNIIWFILIGLIVVFTIASPALTNPIKVLGVLFAGVIGWIALCILTILFFIKMPVIILKKLTYRSELLVENIYWKERVIVGLVYENGTCRRMGYRFASYDKPLLQEMKQYDVVYRYSKNPYPNEQNYCMFIKKQPNS